MSLSQHYLDYMNRLRGPPQAQPWMTEEEVEAVMKSRRWTPIGGYQEDEMISDEQKQPRGMGYYAQPQEPLAQNMLLRDYFAAKAMVGLIAARSSMSIDRTVLEAYQIADTMMKARKT